LSLASQSVSEVSEALPSGADFVEAFSSGCSVLERPWSRAGGGVAMGDLPDWRRGRGFISCPLMLGYGEGEEDGGLGRIEDIDEAE